MAGVLKDAKKKMHRSNWMAANFNVRKMYSAVERMDGYEYSIKIIIVPLKERKKWFPQK